MEKPKALSLKLTGEEMLVLAGHLSVSHVEQMREQVLADWPAERREQVEGLVRHELVARDLLTAADNGNYEINPFAAIAVAALFAPVPTVTVTRQEEDQTIERVEFFVVDGNYVAHTTVEGGIQEFLFFEDLDATRRALGHFVANGSTSAGELEHGAGRLPAVVYAQAVAAAAAGDEAGARSLLSNSPLPVDTAGELAATLLGGPQNILITSSAAAEEGAAGDEVIALLGGGSRFWRIAQDVEELRLQPLSANDINRMLARLVEGLRPSP